MSFTELSLSEPLLRAIEASGYTTPTEIQRQAIPVALAGRDLMASAQTGTGKTAAFVLPALERLQQPAAVQGRGPRVLILTPTRELATQIQEAIARYSRFTKLRSGAIVGGAPYPAQEKLLRMPLDLLVATPGRLMDHMERGRVDFSRMELLVLDEADRMLDMGFIEPVEEISAATPANRQTLLFSATLEGNVEKLARRLLKDPLRIQISGVKEKHANIEQRIHQADDYKHKNQLLHHLLNGQDLTQAIVFTATKRGADKLAEDLGEQGYPCAALHGDMKQSARNRTVQRMRRGDVKVLVATDVAARGLDITGVTHVINFDLPMVAEDYVHRIGRTGRGGAFGIAVSLIGPDDWSKLAQIERLTGNRLDRTVVLGLEPRRPAPKPGERSSSPRSGAGRRPGGGSSRSGAPRQGQGAPRQNQGSDRFDRSDAPRANSFRPDRPRSESSHAPSGSSHAASGQRDHAPRGRRDTSSASGAPSDRSDRPARAPSPYAQAQRKESYSSRGNDTSAPRSDSTYQRPSAPRTGENRPKISFSRPARKTGPRDSKPGY